MEDDTDVASFARRHAGELEPDLTPQQRDLLGRVIAKRIEQGVAVRLIERAAARALPELSEERAHRLARDETLRAFAQSQRAHLLQQGATRIEVSTAADACDACAAGAGIYIASEAPPLPNPACTHAKGCRCLYVAVAEPHDNPRP